MTPQQLKNSILQRAIEGRLVEQRPEEGTAQDLLKEIQAEKTQLVKEGKIKKSKALPPITEEEKPFDIPEGWEWVRLELITSIIGDGIHGTPEYDINGDMYFVNGNNLCNGNIIIKDSTKRLSKKEAEKHMVPLNKNSILISINGTLGNVAFYNNEPVILGKSACYCNLLTSVNKNYIKMIIESAYFMKYALESATGTTIKNVSLKAMRNFFIPLPPFVEQRRIVAKIEELLTLIDKYDKAYTKLTDFNTHFPEAMKKSLLQYAIQGKLVEQRADEGTAQDLIKDIQAEKKRLIAEKKIKKTKALPPITEEEIPFDIPESWAWVRLEDIAANIDNAFADGPFGSNLKREHYTERHEVRIIQLSNIGDMGWRNSNEKYTTFTHLETISRSEVAVGDIVIAKMMPAGRAIEVPDLGTRFVLSSDAVKFVPHKSLYRPYLLYAINSYMFREQINAEVHGITRVRTSLTKLKKYLIPLPPLTEQHRIVAKLEELLPLCDKLIK